MKYFSAEVGWQNLGRFSQTQPSMLFGDLTFDGEVDGIWIDAIGKLPLGRVFDIYGKVGLFFWNTDFTVVNDMNDLAFFSKQTGVNLSYGAGLGFNIARFTIRLEYQEFSTDDTEKLTFASLGLQFNF